MKHSIVALIMLFAVLFTMSSCKDNGKTFTMTVASERRSCQGEGVYRCYLVKYSETDEWTYFYDRIEGFDYVEGFEYVIKVKEYEVENPPMDASSRTYSLIKVISKIKMDSEDLPAKKIV